PTLADARQFAEQVVARWRGGEELEQLLALDDGTARANKGEGIGETREDIRPRELEPLLFAMKDGEFGPLVEMPTGVHIFRLVKRENAGVMAFDDKVQRMIENKLKNEVFDRERRHLVRELRERYRDAIVIVEQRPDERQLAGWLVWVACFRRPQAAESMARRRGFTPNALLTSVDWSRR